METVKAQSIEYRSQIAYGYKSTPLHAHALRNLGKAKKKPEGGVEISETAYQETAVAHTMAKACYLSKACQILISLIYLGC